MEIRLLPIIRLKAYPTAASSQPNTEDLNRDHTLSETESYFQYKVRLFPGMDVGR